MSEKSRKRHSPEFKAKVAEAAIRERQSTADLSQQYRVHPTQVGQWKRQGLAALASASALLQEWPAPVSKSGSDSP